MEQSPNFNFMSLDGLTMEDQQKLQSILFPEKNESQHVFNVHAQVFVPKVQPPPPPTHHNLIGAPFVQCNPSLNLHLQHLPMMSHMPGMPIPQNFVVPMPHMQNNHIQHGHVQHNHVQQNLHVQQNNHVQPNHVPQQMEHVPTPMPQYVQTNSVPTNSLPNSTGNDQKDERSFRPANRPPRYDNQRRAPRYEHDQHVRNGQPQRFVESQRFGETRYQQYGYARRTPPEQRFQQEQRQHDSRFQDPRYQDQRYQDYSRNGRSGNGRIKVLQNPNSRRQSDKLPPRFHRQNRRRLDEDVNSNMVKLSNGQESRDDDSEDERIVVLNSGAPSPSNVKWPSDISVSSRSMSPASSAASEMKSPVSNTTTTKSPVKIEENAVSATVVKSSSNESIGSLDGVEIRSDLRADDLDEEWRREFGEEEWKEPESGWSSGYEEGVKDVTGKNADENFQPSSDENNELKADVDLDNEEQPSSVVEKAATCTVQSQEKPCPPVKADDPVTVTTSKDVTEDSETASPPALKETPQSVWSNVKISPPAVNNEAAPSDRSDPPSPTPPSRSAPASLMNQILSQTPSLKMLASSASMGPLAQTSCKVATAIGSADNSSTNTSPNHSTQVAPPSTQNVKAPSVEPITSPDQATTAPDQTDPVPTQQKAPPPVKSWAALVSHNLPNQTAVVIREKSPPPKSVSPVTLQEREVEDDVPCDMLKDKLVKELRDFLKKTSLLHRSPSLFPRGLVNRANWCYVNATLQALLACPPFYNLFKNMPRMAIKQRGQSCTPVLDSMCQFINEFQYMKPPSRNKRQEQVEISTGEPFEPVYVYSMLQKLKSTDAFKQGRQEDAEEFLICVLNQMHDELLSISNMTQKSPQLDENDDWEQVGRKKKAVITRSNETPKSLISDIFCGQMRSVLRSTGSRESATLEPFFTLPLDIQNEKVVSVKDALAGLVSRELIQGFTCSKTKEEVEATRFAMLELLPPVLILHLKCFIHDKSGGCQKLIKRIEYPVDLEISKDIISQNTRGKIRDHQRNYKLFAVVYHHGKTLQGGHYTTDVFHPGINGWIRIDDNHISVVSVKKVLQYSQTSMPYILYYRRHDSLAK